MRHVISTDLQLVELLLQLVADELADAARARLSRDDSVLSRVRRIARL